MVILHVIVAVGLACSLVGLGICIVSLSQLRQGKSKIDHLLFWQKQLDDTFEKGKQAFLDNDWDEFDKHYDAFQVLKHRIKLERESQFDKK